MYAREEDIIHAVYQQLKEYVKEHFISDLQYKRQMQEFNEQVTGLSKQKTEAWIRAMEQYERFVQGEISKEEFQEAQGVADNALMLLSTATKHRDSLQKEHATFRKLLSTSDKEIPLSEIMGYVDKIVVDDGKQLMVKWRQSKPYWGEPYELDKFSDI